MLGPLRRCERTTRELISAAQRLMEVEVEGLIGAGSSGKSADRLVAHKRIPDRGQEARAGAVEIRIPKLRKGATARLHPAAPHGREDAGHAAVQATWSGNRSGPWQLRQVGGRQQRSEPLGSGIPDLSSNRSHR